MAQRSFFWTTGGAGDGASTYDRAALSAAFAIYAAVSDDEGVAPSYLNALAATIPAANTVRLNTGAAVVDGKAYLNDASYDHNIPSAIGAGNTRIDRVVLRADWTAQTVRITRVAGVDAATPTAPAITQVPGTTYDLLLFQVTVNTSGTVTVTVDERVMGRIQTNGIADDAVTAAKIASGAVGISELGTGIPAILRRVGHATPTNSWSGNGTTVHDLTGVKTRVIFGATQVSAGAGANASVDVDVSAMGFTSTPWVLGGDGIPATVTAFRLSALGIDPNTVRCTFYNDGGASDLVTIRWIAIGPVA